MKYLQDYFLLSSSNDFDAIALVVQGKREGKMRSLSEIVRKCSHCMFSSYFHQESGTFIFSVTIKHKN